jgi:hypothetical protein
MDPGIAAIIGIVATLAVIFVALLICAGGSMDRLTKSLNAMSRVQRNGPGADEILAVIEASAPAGPEPDRPSGEPIRLLNLLQRDGRLIDFLLEDIEGADEVTVGAAVKEIHRKCKDVLQEHVVMEPILRQQEGADVEVPAGFDPSAIRVTGNVTGEPPYKGVLRHHGWRVTKIKLAQLPRGADDLVLAQAEVELPMDQMPGLPGV